MKLAHPSPDYQPNRKPDPLPVNPDGIPAVPTFGGPPENDAGPVAGRAASDSQTRTRTMTSYKGDPSNGKNSCNGRPADTYPFHPLIAGLPLLEGPEFDQLVQDIKENEGNALPILLWHGQVIDGRNRYRACLEARVEPYFEDTSNTPEEELPALVRRLNIYRLHQTAEQRRAYIAILLRDDPTQSNRAIAGQVGVDHKTVAGVRNDLEGRGEIPHVDTHQDTKGRSQPARKPRQPDPGPAGPTSRDVMFDGLGFAVPPRLRDVFGSCFFDDQAGHLRRLANLLRSPDCPFRRFMLWEQVVESLEEVRQKILDAKPFAVHRACKGKGCDDCRHAGWVPHYVWFDLDHHGCWGPDEGSAGKEGPNAPKDPQETPAPEPPPRKANGRLFPEGDGRLEEKR